MSDDAPIFSVSDLAHLAKEVLETTFQTIWVEGELSNVTLARSGHWYFSLKDDSAQIRAAMFKSLNRHLSFVPEEGQLVRIKAKVSLYTPRGDFQLIAEDLQPMGDGALHRRFEKLKAQLQKEGLFDEARKKALPVFPTCVGVITSSTGAAIQDILTTLKRRTPYIHVIVYPTLVQGMQAAPNIVQQVETAHAHAVCDLLIVGRGGGSLEDLWPFNEESVARALAAAEIPVISAVGHETDFTISDFVADLRAPTPTAAAELCANSQETQTQTLSTLLQTLHHALTSKLQHTTWQLNTLRHRLKSPQHLIEDAMQSLDTLENRSVHAMQNTLKDNTHLLQNLAQTLNTLNPLSVLSRGFSVTHHNERILTNTTSLEVGQTLNTRLADGEIVSTIEQIST